MNSEYTRHMERKYRVMDGYTAGDVEVVVIWTITVYEDAVPIAQATVSVDPTSEDEMLHDGHTNTVPIEDVPRDVMLEVVETAQKDSEEVQTVVVEQWGDEDDE